jgi:hypothetical protein
VIGHRLIAFEKRRSVDAGREFRVTPSGVSSRYRSITPESITVEPPDFVPGVLGVPECLYQ